MEDMQVGIIGLGLIGGSIAMDLKARGFASRVVGVETNGLHATEAWRLGLVDAIVSLDECADTSDLVVVAVPVDVALRVVPELLDRCPGKQVVTDVCSTKRELVERVRCHPNRKCFVAAHPMAGTEYSGPGAALPGLFDGRAGILCNTGESGEFALAVVRKMYDCLGMRIVGMDAIQHDIHVAYVSHISHVTSFALALTVLEKEKDETRIFDLASGGFTSTVRLAKSNADMWAPVLVENGENVLAVLDTYLEYLYRFRKCIVRDDEGGIRSLIRQANRIERIVK